MDLFQVLVLGLLSPLLLLVSVACSMKRQAVAAEATAEAVASLLDAKLSETERDAALVMAGLREAEANLPPEGYPVTSWVEEETKPDHPRPLLAPCSRCGLTIGLCHCKRAS